MTIRDLRGVEILVGDAVIYAGTIYKSVTMVEAKVVEVTDKNHIKVEVLRRFHAGSMGRRSVRFLTKTAHDLVVVGMPSSTARTLTQAKEEDQAAYEEGLRKKNSHGAMELIPSDDPAWVPYFERKRCSVCKTEQYSLSRKECFTP